LDYVLLGVKVYLVYVNLSANWHICIESDNLGYFARIWQPWNISAKSGNLGFFPAA